MLLTLKGVVSMILRRSILLCVIVSIVTLAIVQSNLNRRTTHL